MTRLTQRFVFDNYTAPSFLEVEGARDVGIEFHSLSKTFCMTGWRIGFAIGNKDIIAGLAKVKSNMDSGAFQAIQEAAITALTKGILVADNIYKVFERRRNVFVAGLKKAGFECHAPKATFYIWIKCPKGFYFFRAGKTDFRKSVCCGYAGQRVRQVRRRIYKGGFDRTGRQVMRSG